MIADCKAAARLLNAFASEVNDAFFSADTGTPLVASLANIACFSAVFDCFLDVNALSGTYRSLVDANDSLSKLEPNTFLN